MTSCTRRRILPPFQVTQGYGVIGNTSVSGTAIRGSSPCSPTQKGADLRVSAFLHPHSLRAFFTQAPPFFKTPHCCPRQQFRPAQAGFRSSRRREFRFTQSSRLRVRAGARLSTPRQAGLYHVLISEPGVPPLSRLHSPAMFCRPPDSKFRGRCPPNLQ